MAIARWVRSAGCAVLAAAALSCGQPGAESRGSATVGSAPANVGLVEASDVPIRGGKLRYALAAETNGWNPASSQWAGPGLTVARSIFDTLAAFDSESRIHPWLADAFEPNATFTEWTIRLRAGVQFHDGSEVDAEAVARGQRYLQQSPVTKSAYVPIDRFDVVDDLTLRVVLNRPWATYPMALATQIGVVAEPRWLESGDALHPVGTGPFVFESWTSGKALQVKRNPNYWLEDERGDSMPYLDQIEFVTLTDAQSRLNALKSSDVDVAQSIPGNRLKDLEAEAAAGGDQLFAKTAGETSEVFVMLNTSTELLADVDARRALVYATDARAYSDVVTDGTNEIARGPFSPSSKWFSPSNYPAFDPEQARTLVEQVKARHGGSFDLRLWAIPDPNVLSGAQLLQQQWADVGVNVTVESVEQAKLIGGVVTGSYDAVLWNQFDGPHPSLDTVWWAPEIVTAPPNFTLNFARYRNDALGDQLKALLAAPDDAAAKPHVDAVQRELNDGVPYIWLYHTQVSFAAKRNVVNLVNYRLPGGEVGLDQMQGSYPLHQVWLRR